MKNIYFLVVLLAFTASGQIMPFMGRPGPFSRFGPFGPGRLYGGIYGPGGIPTSTYYSYYDQIRQRVDAYTSPAITILMNAVNNFQICEKDFFMAKNLETYKSCMSGHVNKAISDMNDLESNAKEPSNTTTNE